MSLQAHYPLKACVSANAKLGSEDLIRKIKANVVKMDVLPNTYQNYTGQLETTDFLSFCKFLESRRGRKILELMEDWE